VGAPDDPSTEILPAAPVEVAPAPELIGRSLGKFTILEKLGRGGSGEVFRAEQAQLGRSAVIKVLRHEVATAPNRVERFLREAKLASRLDHPYAAHIYAFGAEPDGVLWIAMEHVRGMTLDELVARRGAMPASVFGPLFARLCEVVHTAHELGIIHRDIKGANVMVIERAGQLLPKLLDFGIAKGDVIATTPGTDELTGHGVTLGSPHYMSPEQWEAAGEVDARADIYALGVLAYRCISGALPFHAENRMELVDMHRRQPPPPLPEFVPPAMAEAIVRALAKKPEDRWATAIGLGDAIRRGASVAAPEAVPIFEPGVRQAWTTGGPQPIADAIARLSAAATTVEADATLRELVAITCRWLAVVALSGLTKIEPSVRDKARAVLGRDDGTPWLELARAAVLSSLEPLPGLAAAITGAEPLAKLADRLDDRDRQRTAAALAADVEAVAEALRPLEPLLAYQLVVGGGGAAAESWQGPRRRDREKVLVWGDPLADGEVALLDASGKVVARLSPLAQVISPLPSSEPELFLLWRSGRGSARLVAAPWGFERDDDAAGQRLAALSTEDSDTQHDAADDRSPYPGLAAYREGDADHFVGREREVEALANRLVRAPLLAVLGPSGVGKSSFIHAGVVPRLGEQHRILTMRPGRHPMHVLASLPPVSSDSQDETALVGRLRELGESAQRGLVIVVDQLEELVTLCADPKERQRFAETLAAVADGPGAPVRVVATLRGDFATVIESQDAFRGRFEVFVLATPPPDALRRIVVEPARRATVSVDTQVVDDMVAEVAGRPASLPLLSFTASQLWATRDKQGRRISHDSYLALGGVAGALATYADHLYASLARRDQDTVRDLFARLVAADGTRIPSPRKELEELPGARGVLAHLIDARLLVVRDDEGTDVVEIVHECLAERWPRLARWRSEDAADRALLGDVHAAARRWLDAGRRPDLLWRGEALAELSRLAARSTALTEAERAFAEAAAAAAVRARRVRRGVVAAAMVALAAVAGVMAYLSIQANDSRHQAETSATKAGEARALAEDRLTQSLIAQGRRELADNRELNALAYFRAALERGANTHALREMISIANRGRSAELHIATGSGMATLVASPAGWFASGDETGTVHYFKADGAPDGEVVTGQPFVSDVRLTPDGGLVLSVADAVLVVDAQRHVAHTVHTKAQPWSAVVGPDPDAITTVDRDGFHVYGLDGTLRRTMPGPPEGTDGPIAIAADAKHAAWKAGSTITVADLIAGTSRTLTMDARNALAASPDGTLFAYIDKTDGVHLVETSGHELRVVKPQLHPAFVAVSSGGDRFAAAALREVEVFDRDGKSLVNFATQPEQYALEMRGDDVWSSGTDGTVRHYVRGILVADRPSHVTPVRILLLAGSTIASLAEDSTLVFAKADEQQLVMAPEVCPHPSFGPLDLLTTYICDDALHVYNGRELLADEPTDRELMSGQYEPTSKRTMIYDQDGLTVFDHERKPIAKLPIAHEKHLGAPAWRDGDHILLGEENQAVWQWTISTNAFAKLLDVPQIYAQVPIADGLIVGTGDNKVMKLVEGKVVHAVDVHDRVEHLSLSPDRKWALAQLTNGSVAIIDTTSGEVTRQLGPAEQSGGDPIFDTTGDLIMREARNELTIWDRASGDEIVFNFRLLDGLMGGRFLPDGRIEVAARSPALLDIPLDSRPVASIIRDIACRVPLEVRAGRLGPSTPKCD
jgi:tRNA A-37 threonylcarbamoyl transferase component Bud32